MELEAKKIMMAYTQQSWTETSWVKFEYQLLHSRQGPFSIQLPL